jgi:hypothetical protein
METAALPKHIPAVDQTPRFARVCCAQDRICNEFWKDADGDASYVERLWRAVPVANRATTAILHLPHMTHRPDSATLSQVLPVLVAYAAAGLAPASRPTSAALSTALPCWLVTEENPAGDVLR